MPDNQSMKIAAVQFDIAWEAPEENLKRIESMLEVDSGSYDLILLPEMFATGFTMEPEPVAEEMDGTSVRWMQQYAGMHDVCVIGSLVIREEGRFYNRMLAFTPEGLVYQYDKRHLFTMAGEHNRYTPGNTKGSFEWRGWKISGQICYDLRFPVWSRQDKENLFDLLLYAANWPEPRISHWKALLGARAIENQCYVAGVSRVGLDGLGIHYSGDSMIVDPKGNILRTFTRNAGIISATLDKEELEAYRKKFPAWQDADTFSVITDPQVS